jgi:DNA-binding response OmpR family regulator
MDEHQDLQRSMHPRWLALAADGPALGLPALVPDGSIRVVSDAGSFLSLLERARPRIAIVGTPPAGERELTMVASWRRRRPSLRVVQLAAPEAVQARLDALRLGFDEALATDIDPAELAGRLALLQERARPRTDRVIRVTSDCELDLIGHELRRDGRIVHLRPKEYQLLMVLALHPGRAYTRRQLLDRAWGHDHDGDQRTVDVHVRWLRSKIEAEPDHPVHLVTVRGVGYRLDPPAP